MEQKNKKLSTQSYKGARDFYPEDMRARNYIFETWKKVCRKYGFDEYDFPILEPYEIFAAKTGEEIVKDQLYSFEDKGGRKLAIRPELTPGTVRMIAQKYKELVQPIKWFMIGNNWRFEKPQLGRGREFYQLEVNIFGEKSVAADFEIFSIIIDVMTAFGAKKEQFALLLSDRRLISALLSNALKLSEEMQAKVRRLMDKRSKMEKEEFLASLKELGINPEQCRKVEAFMNCCLESISSIIPPEILNENDGYKSIKELFEMLNASGLGDYCRFDPSIIRGFDYSDGLVYEVFDKNPKNSRSIFGGERFDKLINIFGDFDLPATGFAMGDYTLLEFLKNWNLLPEFDSKIKYFISVWPQETDKNSNYFKYSQQISAKLREKGENCLTWLDKNTKLEKQLKYADKKGIPYSIIAGEQELKNSTVKIKNMRTQKQETKSMEEFFNKLY